MSQTGTATDIRKIRHLIELSYICFSIKAPPGISRGPRKIGRSYKYICKARLICCKSIPRLRIQAAVALLSVGSRDKQSIRLSRPLLVSEHRESPSNSSAQPLLTAWTKPYSRPSLLLSATSLTRFRSLYWLSELSFNCCAQKVLQPKVSCLESRGFWRTGESTRPRPSIETTGDISGRIGGSSGGNSHTSCLISTSGNSVCRGKAIILTDVSVRWPNWSGAGRRFGYWLLDSTKSRNGSA